MNVKESNAMILDIMDKHCDLAESNTFGVLDDRDKYFISQIRKVILEANP